MLDVDKCLQIRFRYWAHCYLNLKSRKLQHRLYPAGWAFNYLRNEVSQLLIMQRAPRSAIISTCSPARANRFRETRFCKRVFEAQRVLRIIRVFCNSRHSRDDGLSEKRLDAVYWNVTLSDLPGMSTMKFHLTISTPVTATQQATSILPTPTVQ